MLTSPGWRARTPQTHAVMAFSVGLVAGAAFSAFALSLLSGVASVAPVSLRSAILILAALIGAHREWGYSNFALPERQRLVPQAIFQKKPLRAASQFGLELGTGVRTYVPSAMPYVLALAILTSGPSLPATAAIAVGFGLGRAAMPWLRLVAPSPADWDGLMAIRIEWIGRVASSVILLWSIGLVLRGGWASV